MKKSLSAALLVGALAIGIAGQTVFAQGSPFNIKGGSSIGAEQEDDLRIKGDNSLRFEREDEDDDDQGIVTAGLSLGLGAKHDDDAAEDMKGADRKNEHRSATATLHASSSRDVSLHAIAGVARVTAISSSTITAEQSWKFSDKSGRLPKTVTIVTNGDTAFLTRTNATSSLGDIAAGDVVSFKGTITVRDSASYTVNASRVRVWGDIDVASKAKVTGTVQSVDETNDQLIIKTDDNQTITINASNDTVVKASDGSHGTFADIAVGATVKVKGWWNSLKDAIAAIRIRII